LRAGDIKIVRSKAGRTIQTPPGRVSRYFYRRDTGQVSRSAIDLSPRLPLNRDALAWFLTIGYVPGTQTLCSGLECLSSNAHILIRPGAYTVQRQVHYADYVEPERYAGWDMDALLDEAAQLFRAAIKRSYLATGGRCVVPISGGLDSRAILAALLEIISAAQVFTYTFGTPGTWDFDIGRQVARAAGTQHQAYDLTQYEYTQKRLERIAVLSDGNTDLFTYPPLDWIERDFGPDSTYWVGFMGDPLAGSHLADDPVQNVVSCFISHNRYGHFDLVGAVKDVTLELQPLLLSMDGIESSKFASVCDYELLDFANRQERYTAHQVFLRELNYATPFLDADWMRFMLSVPLELRRGQKLYRRMLRREFPDLFALPTKNTAGLPLGAFGFLVQAQHIRHKAGRKLAKWAQRSYLWPATNYIDFAAGIRSRDDLRTLVRESLNRLKGYDLVDTVKLEYLWNRHMSGEADFSLSLQLLTSLEIILSKFGIVVE